MKFSCSVAAPELRNLHCLRVRTAALLRIRRVSTSGRAALCSLCAFLWVLVGSGAQAHATTVTFMSNDQFIVPWA